MEDTTSFIKETAEEMLARLGIEGTLTLDEYTDDHGPAVSVSIETEESKLLIGERGGNLIAFQHLLRVLVNHKMEDHVGILVDVNNYRKEKQERLEGLARKAMEKVKATGQLVILKPMSSFDRKVIHTVIAEDEQLSSESLGEEPNRRVVIKVQKTTQTLDEVSDDVDL